MMNVRAFTNTDLVSRLKVLVKSERDTMIEILWHLHEVEYRRIHLDAGFSSLFEYCTTELGYSAGAAARRISAMRLLVELPELEVKLREGSLHLSQLAQAQGHFRLERKEGRTPTPEEKLGLLEALEGKTSRETERMLVSINPRNAPLEQERMLSAELTEIRFVANAELMEKIEAVRGQLSHVLPNPTYAELFEKLIDLALKKKAAPSAKSELPDDASLRPAPEFKEAGMGEDEVSFEWVEPSEKKSETPPVVTDRGPGLRTAIPVGARKVIYERAGGRCEYISTETGRRCGSQHQLEIDHCKPISKGGSSCLGNLRLYCKQHNLRAAEKVLGREWMQKYRKGSG